MSSSSTATIWQHKLENYVHQLFMSINQSTHPHIRAGDGNKASVMFHLDHITFNTSHTHGSTFQPADQTDASCLCNSGPHRDKVVKTAISTDAAQCCKSMQLVTTTTRTPGPLLTWRNNVFSWAPSLPFCSLCFYVINCDSFISIFHWDVFSPVRFECERSVLTALCGQWQKMYKLI